MEVLEGYLRCQWPVLSSPQPPVVTSASWPRGKKEAGRGWKGGKESREKVGKKVKWVGRKEKRKEGMEVDLQMSDEDIISFVFSIY